MATVLRRGAALVLMIGLAGCGSGGAERDRADVAAQRWVAGYGDQLDRWSLEAGRLQAAAGARDWSRVSRIVRRIGRDGAQVRDRFADVPAALSGAATRYALLVAAGDAATEWARVYRADPPPYASTAQGRRRARVLADAVDDFQRKANAAADALAGGAAQPS